MVWVRCSADDPRGYLAAIVAALRERRYDALLPTHEQAWLFALICQWTWACAAPPRGPNQHANQAGYQIIAQTFQRAAGLS